MTMAVQIICGDCSGDDTRPRKTYLNKQWRCSTCGGRSYTLAADLGLNAERTRREKVAQYDAMRQNETESEDSIHIN